MNIRRDWTFLQTHADLPGNPAMCRVPQRAGTEAHRETAAGLSAADLDGYLAILLMGALQARSRSIPSHTKGRTCANRTTS